MNNKPRFEDTLPLDEDKPKFDDTLPLEEETTNKIPVSASVGLGALKGASMGLIPYGTLSEGEELPATMGGTGSGFPLEDRFQMVEQNKRLLEESQKQNPVASGLGEFAGAAALPISSSRIVGQAGIGAASGGISALTEGRIEEVPQQAALGAGIGTAGGAAAKAIGKGAVSVRDYLMNKFPSLKKLGQESALEAMSPTMEKLEEFGEGSKGFAERARIGKVALDEGVVPAVSLDPSRSMAVRTEEAMAKTKINDIMATLDNAAEFNKSSFIDNATRRFKEQIEPLKGSDAYNKAMQEFDDTLQEMIGAESLTSFSGANKVKGFVDKKISDKAIAGTKEAGQADAEKLAIRRGLKDTIMTTADDFNIAPELKNEYQRYSDLADIKEMTNRSERRFTSSEASNRASLGNLTVGNILKPLNLIGQNIKTTQARAGDFVRKTLETSPEKLGKYAQILSNANAKGAFDSTHYVLMQSDPEYRKMILGEDK